jgi:hypothetical protein
MDRGLIWQSKKEAAAARSSSRRILFCNSAFSNLKSEIA